MEIKIGSLFREITGRDPSSCKSILEAERVTERVIGKKLDIKEFPSELVPTRGTVFKIRNITTEEIDSDIDAHLKRMKIIRLD